MDDEDDPASPDLLVGLRLSREEGEPIEVLYAGPYGPVRTRLGKVRKNGQRYIGVGALRRLRDESPEGQLPVVNEAPTVVAVPRGA